MWGIPLLSEELLVSLLRGFIKGVYSFSSFVIILTSNCRTVIVLRVLNCYVCSVLATFVTDFVSFGVPAYFNIFSWINKFQQFLP
jgi:hypothetical protein